jgi:hypothetical protein
VEPETLDRVYAVAEALGVSLTAYVEELIRHDQLDEQGRPVWWTDPAPQDQEELPLTQTA